MIKNPIVKLQINQKLSLSDLNVEINNGGKFIIYQYCISLIAITLRRFSPAYFIKSDENPNKYAAMYNRITILFGWWGLPFGPIFSIQSLKLNNTGGTDVTDDIMLNINRSDYEKGIAIIIKSNLVFSPVDKWDRKSITRVIKSINTQDLRIKKVYLGRHLNSPDKDPPYLTIGLDSELSLNTIDQALQSGLLKEYKPGTKFQILDINDNSELSKWLSTQGDLIFDNQQNNP